MIRTKNTFFNGKEATDMPVLIFIMVGLSIAGAFIGIAQGAVSQEIMHEIGEKREKERAEKVTKN